MQVKHIGYLALLMSFLACTQEKYGRQDQEEVFRASAPSAQPVTRSQIDAAGTFTWEATDRIAVHYSNAFPSYSGYRTAALKDGAGNATATFTLIPNGTRDGVALYPAIIADKDYPGLSGGELRVNMPQSYLLESTSMGWNAPLPMIARNFPEQNLDFEHLGALVRLTLDNVPAGTRYIRVASDFNISGSFEVLDPSGEPYIAADSSNSDGDFSFVVFTFPKALTALSSGLVLNVPFPTGHYTNLTVAALDASHIELSCVNAGVDRVLARGKMREIEIDFTGEGHLTTFSLEPLTATITGTRSLSYSLRQVKASGGEEPARDYSIVVDNVSNPDVARLSVNGTNVYVTGLSAGETMVRLKASKGTDVVYAATTVTVDDPILSIWSTAEWLFTQGTMKLRASMAYVGTDVTDSADLLYHWTVAEGAGLASIAGNGPSAVLTAGPAAGTVKVKCRISSKDPDGLLSAVETEQSFTIIEAPTGVLRGMFSVSATQKVYFARANAYKQKSDGRYYLFEKQWDAYNGVQTQEAPDVAAIMDCVDPQTVVANFGSGSTSTHIWVDGSETDGWRLFSYDEANYLLNRRLASPVGSTDNARYVCAKVGGVAGLIIFPDEFIWPNEMVLPQDINAIRMEDAAWIRLDFPNSYTFNEWTNYLQPLGAVFLPGWLDAPAYLSKARWDDASIPANRKRNVTAEVNRPWNYYTSWYLCYYIYDSYLRIERPMNYTQVRISTPDYYPIDYVRYFHLRPVKDVE